MMAVVNLSSPSAPPPPRQKPDISFSLLSLHNTHKPNISLLQQSLPNYNNSSLSFSLSRKKGFCLYAQNKIKDSTFSGVEKEESENIVDNEFEFDDDYEFDEDDDEFEEDDVDDDVDDDDDDELLVPLEKMNDWLENKPRGFGEGKVYDTSLEDKLLEEIEQSFKAQAANVDKLKREAIKSTSKAEVQGLFNASESVPEGIRVRINNLPKKKNIHRDLKAAFKGVPGIINISPVNSGNKKTRDPVCKGIAFVDFKSIKDANRFVQMFSGQIVSFGKSGKPIKCEILKPLDSSYEGLSYSGYNTISDESFDFLGDEDDDVAGYDSEDDDFQELVEGPDGKFVLGNSENLSEKERIERIEMLESKLLSRAALYEKEMKSMKEEPEDLKEFKGNSEGKSKVGRKTNQKKVDNKTKSDKKPKPNIPGSSKKLKVREKAKLADVFSRYGMKDSKASK